MDTRPKHVKVTAQKAFIEERSNAGRGTPCSRERFFRQARKPDDGDAGAHRRGRLTPHGGKRSAGRPESFMNYSG